VIVLSIVMLALAGGPVSPGPTAWMQIVTAMIIGFVAYWAIIEATRAGDVSVITPFRYTRLIFALGLAFVMFAERPDRMTLIGAALVIASGLYTLYRERRRKVEGSRSKFTDPIPESQP
jgi:drug/metabolite transporter (DMT)-like permease